MYARMLLALFNLNKFFLTRNSLRLSLFLILFQAICVNGAQPESPKSTVATTPGSTDPFKDLPKDVSNMITAKLPLRDIVAFGAASKETQTLASEGISARIQPLLDKVEPDCIFGGWAKENTYSVYLAFYHFVKKEGREFVQQKLGTSCSRHDGKTPALLAAQNGNNYFIKSFLEFGVFDHVWDQLRNDLRVIGANEVITQMERASRQLLASIVAGDKKQFQVALDNPHLLTVNYMLWYNKRLNTVSPLNLAIYKNMSNFVGELLVRSARVDYGWPLGFSIISNCFDCFNLLLKHGASITEPRPALHEVVRAAPSPNAIKMAQILLKKGADINVKDERGWTPMYWLRDNNVEMAKFILGHNPDINHVDKYGNSALHAAVRMGQVNIVRLLLESKASVQIVEKGGRNLLAELCRSVVQLKFGLDKNKLLLTPIVKMLLEHGADPTSGGRIDIKSCLRQASTVVPNDSDVQEALKLVSQPPAKQAGRPKKKNNAE